MGHHVTGVIAKAETCRALSKRWSDQAICSLSQGFALLPLDYQNLRFVRVSDTSGVVDEFVYVTPDLIATLCDASQGIEFAYVETEYHGGTGGQGALLFQDGKLTFGPEWADAGPISTALRKLGVTKSDQDFDEFEAVGLSQLRMNEAARRASRSEQDNEELLSELYAEVERLGALIDAPKHLLPNKDRKDRWLEINFFEGNDGDDLDGYWICLCGSDSYECGVEHADKLLEYVFGGVTHQMAMATRTPRAGEDARRSLFAAQEALLSQLNDEWAARKAEAHRQTLKNFPFEDS